MMKKIKSEDEQYLEQTSQVIGCKGLTQAVSIILTDGNQRLEGSATRMRDGWFCITLSDDRLFKIREANLYNKNIYKVIRPKVMATSEERDKLNRKAKRQSKRTEMELTKLRKEAATKARLKMIEDFKDVVCGAVEKEILEENY